MSAKEEKAETKVFVDGKLVSLKDLERRYAEIIIAAVPGNVRIVEALLKADKPLTRHDAAKKANMSVAYATQILKTLAKKGYVLEFQMGRSKHKYYLLTEKGLRFSETLVKQ